MISAANQQIAALERIDAAWAGCLQHLSGPGLQHLIAARESLERRREQVDAGDTLAILQALAQCCAWSLPAPAWLADAFTTRLQAFTNCEPGPETRNSLDDLFRSPLLRPGQPKRTAKDRADWALGCRLWGEVRRIARQHRGLDSALTEVLRAGNWPVRKRRARELVELIDRTQVHLTSGAVRPLSSLWSKSCKQVREGRQQRTIAATSTNEGNRADTSSPT